MRQFVLYHNPHPFQTESFKGAYKVVTFDVYTNGPLEELLEEIFRVTNNIESSWVKDMRDGGLVSTRLDAIQIHETPYIKETEQPANFYRSTSVGDLVHDVTMGTFYACENAGWSIVPRGSGRGLPDSMMGG